MRPPEPAPGLLHPARCAAQAPPRVPQLICALAAWAVGSSARGPVRREAARGAFCSPEASARSCRSLALSRRRSLPWGAEGPPPSGSYRGGGTGNGCGKFGGGAGTRPSLCRRGAGARRQAESRCRGAPRELRASPGP